LASLHELLYVRKSDRKGPIRKREKFPRTAINQVINKLADTSSRAICDFPECSGADGEVPLESFAIKQRFAAVYVAHVDEVAVGN